MSDDTLTFGVGIPAPEPGYYPGVPMDVYLQWDAASKGRLVLLKRSPAHLREHILRDSAETDALRFGSAAHMAVLEPELFSVRYARKEQCAAHTDGGEGPRCRSQGKYLTATGRVLCGTHYDGEEQLNDTTILLAPEQYAACLAMRRVFAGKLKASGLLEGAGEFELSLVWHERVEVTVEGEVVEVTVPCKARIDRYSAVGGGTLGDMKTTTDASRYKFERAIFRYFYHTQGWFYMRGARAVNLPARHFAILAAEKEPPYEVNVYRLTEGALDAGGEVALQLLKLYARCQHTSTWPGYQDRVQDIALPDWAWRATDDDLGELEETWQL